MTALASIATEPTGRQIAARSRGEDIGAITRMLGPWVRREPPYEPCDLSERLKPFVFLDIFNTDGLEVDTRLHPHSGLATVTYLLEGSVMFEDTTGRQGVMPEGAVEWFRAGRGAWHGGGPGPDGPARGFQLWLALPPDQELGEVESIYLPKAQTPRQGPATVLLGEYDGVASPLPAPSDLTYLAVRLKAGERWRYSPARSHTVCMLALARGELRVPDSISGKELVAFAPSNGDLEIEAVADSEFVLGSAAPHPHPLALGHYSVHTSRDALRQGEAQIAEIRSRLYAEGRLPAP